MKTIFVVRHCQAEGQEPGAGLTEQGVRQAEALAEFLFDKKIDAIISSPYERAYRTIQPLAGRLGIEAVLDERLAERVLSSRNQPEWRNMLRRTFEDLDLSFEGGESSRTAMGRALDVVKDALESGNHQIVIVSHGNLISLLLKHFDDTIGFDEWEALSNPDVFRLAFSEEKPVIQRIWTD
ncbi:histidine phosphatase family protein [Paenibacillus nanensis]|uniref:Histidine phosphatase family protein n=1 Tax=Paenibacillus nanensis TaxID=393251 RepID=A0A3A1UQ39_9BACL|nr:histidine phosphatase family protein [Paenibacillus nanensis]RIX48646.1 histidine phosphatase family protein [Paenibacillus nanensis]